MKEKSRISPLAGLLIQIFAGVTLTVVLLCALEFVAGLFVPDAQPKEIAGDTVSRTVTWIDANPTPMVRDPDLLWRNKPGGSKTQPVNPRPYGTNETWTVNINSEGFRGPERDVLGSGDSVFRIVCVGDSITFGFNVEFDATYPQQLLALLQQRYPGRTFDIVDAGVPGWSWLQGLKFIESRALDLKPNLIIVGHGTNDQFFPAKVPDEDRFLMLGSPLKRTLKRLALYASETNIYRAISSMVSKPAAFDPSKPAPASPGDHEDESRGCMLQRAVYKVCRRVTVPQITEAVLKIAEITKKAGVALIVANTDFMQTAAVDGSRAAAEQGQIPFVDLVEGIYGERTRLQDERSQKLGLAPATRFPEAHAKFPSALEGTTPPTHQLLRVLVKEPSETYRVKGKATYGVFNFDEPVFDDGTHGDERAGDLVYSADVTVPGAIWEIHYKFSMGEIEEFQPLPPLASTLGVRQMQTAENAISPVHVFGQSTFMAENAHPNRDGHRINARLLADKLEEIPAFREYIRKTEQAAQAGAGTHS